MLLNHAKSHTHKDVIKRLYGPQPVADLIHTHHLRDEYDSLHFSRGRDMCINKMRRWYAPISVGIRVSSRPTRSRR